MYIVGSIILSGILLWAADRQNKKNLSRYDRLHIADEALWRLALHARQDMKLIVFLLTGVIVMLGVVAERMQ